MTWIDRVENTIFTIRTGDGKTFYPALPIGYETSKEFNAAQFEFINVEGALVNRRKVKARNFPLNFFFTGEDNIDQAADFDLSCNDSRYWMVFHPMYGSIQGQPISIKRSDANLNATQFTVDFWESIITDPLIAFGFDLPSFQGRISKNLSDFSMISPIDYNSKIAIKPSDISKIKQQAINTNDLINKALPAGSYEVYQQLQYNMFIGIDNMAADAALGISAIQEVLLAPASFAISVKDRIDLFVALYNNSVQMLNDAYTANNKAYLEAAGGMIVAAMAYSLSLTTSLSEFAFATRDQVISASNNLTGLYNNYLATLNTAYVPIGNPGSSYSMSQQTQNSLQNIVFQTLASLQTIAFNAKVERFVTLGTDSQLIVLTHKYLGLDALDANIETFRTINNLKNGALFLIPKGTEIKYYA